MKIDLIDVVSNENKTSEYEICLEATDININGIDCGVVCSPCFFMRVTNQAGARLDIEADGEVRLSVPCDRCLEPVEITVFFRFFCSNASSSAGTFCLTSISSNAWVN